MYILNGMLTQTVRITLGEDIQEAHMRNRALIANWCYAHSDGVISLTKHDGKTFVVISDYERLRGLFAELLWEIQRIKSTGDYEAARMLVETYGVKIDRELHEEMLERYRRLNIAPYKGFLNARMTPVFNDAGEIEDVTLDYTETLTQQMMRYGRDYSL
jgi:dipeptidyl-peptidase-3